MTVLKDAASAALYGSRGANGVIIITTKQGDQNTKATVKVKASLGGSNRAVRDYDRVSTDQYFELYWEALRNQYAKSADYTPATAATQASKDLVTKLMGGGPNPYTVLNMRNRSVQMENWWQVPVRYGILTGVTPWSNRHFAQS